MRPSWIGVTVLSALLGCQRTQPDAGVAFVHVNVVDVEQARLLADQTVVVQENRIVEVGPSTEVAPPGTARVVDGSGRYLMPGLWDMHTHLFGLGIPAAPQVTFPLLIANGVTGARNANGILDLELAWREEVRSHRVIGPRMFVSGQYLDGIPTVYLPVATVVRTPEQARRAVRSLADRGVDLIKTYEMLRPEVYRAIIDEAKRFGLPVFGHVPLRVDAGEASDLGVRSLEHGRNIELACSRDAEALLAARTKLLDEGTARHGMELRAEIHWLQRPVALATYDAARCQALLERMVKNGTFATPTLWESSREARRPDRIARVREQTLRFIPAASRPEWDAWSQSMDRYTEEQVAARVAHAAWLFKLARDMHNAGVPLLAGTDIAVVWMVPGYSLHDELGLLVEAGLSPGEALQTATLNPAKFFDAVNDLGTVRPGRLADLVLLDADPLVDIANTRRIRAVVTDGQYLDRDALDRMLDLAAEAAASGDADRPKRPIHH
jgi:imidazolonepropionase-like amidohydrolase